MPMSRVAARTRVSSIGSMVLAERGSLIVSKAGYEPKRQVLHSGELCVYLNPEDQESLIRVVIWEISKVVFFPDPGKILGEQRSVHSSLDTLQ